MAKRRTKKKKVSATASSAQAPSQPPAPAPAPRIPWAWIGLGLLTLAALVAVSRIWGSDAAGDDDESGAQDPLPPPVTAQQLQVHVLHRYPHDTEAFTQGLLWSGGKLYESTGLRRHSSLREVELASGHVIRQRDNEPTIFAEGLALVGDRLFQITWQDHRALVWNRADFAFVREHRYDGEGWGLCYDGAHLVMSDGSDRLVFRDPETFEPARAIRVRLEGRPLRHLNELECVDGNVWANVWQTDDIVRIDPQTGNVTARVDASGLLTEEEELGTDVLNGIAWVPETHHFLITGKDWPVLFEVEFVPRAAGSGH